ncbi:YicC family protein [bacterium BMS3Abin03]|nr:YicC family protein [bacterium BMS3Abin03]
MISSMTGYGRGVAVKNKQTAEVELKSVNSRFLEINLKLPFTLSDREFELREILKKRIKRGKINGVIQFKREGIDDIVKVDGKKLKSYLALIEKVKRTAKIKEELKLEHILGNNDIISSSDTGITEGEFNLVKKAFNTAIDVLIRTKRNEGNELSKDLKKRISSIEKKVTSIEKEFKKGVTDYHQKLKERVDGLIQNAKENDERLHLELALIADKADITEECVRLKSHLKFFVESLMKDEEPGRKLNFLCQELNREANTISSKSISTSVTHKAVLIKEQIEKIREQIQNIE